MHQSELTADPVIDTIIRDFAACRRTLLRLATKDTSLFAETRSTPEAGATSARAKPKPMPTIAYQLVTDKKIKEMLRSLGLPTSGRKDDLTKLHAEYTLLYNIACDSSEPIDRAEIAKRAIANHRRLHSATRTVTDNIFAKARRGSSSLQKHRSGSSTASIRQRLVTGVQRTQQQRRQLQRSKGGANTQTPDATSTTLGPWRSVFSEVVGKPFYYNMETKVGQFEMPSDISSLIQHHAQGGQRTEPYLICIDPTSTVQAAVDPKPAVTIDSTASTSASRTSPTPRKSKKTEPVANKYSTSPRDDAQPVAGNDDVKRQSQRQPSPRSPSRQQQLPLTESVPTTAADTVVKQEESKPKRSPKTASAVRPKKAQKSQKARKRQPPESSSVDDQVAVKKTRRLALDSKALRLQRRERNKWQREIEKVNPAPVFGFVFWLVRLEMIFLRKMQVRAMGFDVDPAKLRDLLQKKRGNVEAVINALLSSM